MNEAQWRCLTPALRLASLLTIYVSSLLNLNEFKCSLLTATESVRAVRAVRAGFQGLEGHKSGFVRLSQRANSLLSHFNRRTATNLTC